ncbi:MFS transporter [Actinomadura barringtoniae]|uniref:MFS transporter n=1 Tax=Actinomadura barringtoniae TaxID=1427535 RepID=A0A939PHV9_9ACTN|nr:MFS transporter [Actinomadura barringtoniae]MBO2452940.1 MFS transporter [Actinomadura barringtoniae]
MERRARGLLAVLLTGQFMVNVDIAIVNVAAPAVRSDLHPSGGALELVISGYTLTYAMLLITGARLGDTWGHRRSFLGGLALFTLASLACGLAPATPALIVARIVQGAAGALMVPQVLSGIQTHFVGKARERAQGLLVLTLSGGAVAGQALGGIVVSADLFGLSWRPIFLINVPVGLAMLALGPRLMPADVRGERKRLDLGGVALLSAAVLAAMLPLVFGRELHWPVWLWVMLAASVPALVAFVLWQRRVKARGGYPLLNLEVIAQPVIRWGLASLAASTATYFALMFVLALYLQQGLGKSPLFSGLVLVSWVAAFGIAGPVLPRCPQWFSSRAAVIGYVILAVAYLAIGASHAHPVPLVIALGFGGLGLGMGFASMLGRMSAALPQRYAADMSGLFNTNAQLAAVAGVAVFGTVYLGFADRPQHAFTIVTSVFAASALTAAVLAAITVRLARRTAVSGAESASGSGEQAGAAGGGDGLEAGVGAELAHGGA